MPEKSNIETVQTSHGTFAVDMVRDKKIGDRLQSGEYHQNETLELLQHFITPDSVVVDIGAHIGTLAIPLARLAGKVIAFEPTPTTFALLKKNIEANNLAIDARNKGLGEISGAASLVFERSENAGANALRVGKGIYRSVRLMMKSSTPI
jgi:tRNA A58 N-methylase Trm61